MRLNIKPLSINDAWQGKRFKTDKYKKYERDLLLILPRDYPVPKDGNLRLYVLWGLSSSLSDWDNPIKPFVDVLQQKYGFNDKRIKRGNVEVLQVEKGAEFIEFELLAL